MTKTPTDWQKDKIKEIEKAAKTFLDVVNLEYEKEQELKIDDHDLDFDKLWLAGKKIEEAVYWAKEGFKKTD